jgi:hypothetical protein
MIKLQQATLLDKRLACTGLLLLHCVQVLDVGRCSSLWRLPTSLLRLSQLERLVVPSKAIAQVGGVRLLLFAGCPALHLRLWCKPLVSCIKLCGS